MEAVFPEVAEGQTVPLEDAARWVRSLTPRKRHELAGKLLGAIGAILNMALAAAEREAIPAVAALLALATVLHSIYLFVVGEGSEDSVS